VTRPPLARVSPADGCAWVTGASSGLGRAIALALAAEGWTIGVSARRADELENLAREVAPQGRGRIIPLPLDVTDAQAFAAAHAQLQDQAGPVALAVANAGVYLPTDGLAIDPALYQKTFDINVMGVIHHLAAVVPGMAEKGRGQVAIVSSVTGYGGLPQAAAYGASKAALINMAQALAFDLNRRGIRVQVINPGFVDTPATADNPFPMPFLMPVDQAAARVVAGLKTGGFEVTFPRRFTWFLKLINLLPADLYLPLVARATGWAAKD